MNFTESLQSYKKQQIENLKNMNKYAYNKVRNGVEAFGTNVVDESNDTTFDYIDDNGIDDNGSDELVLTSKDDDDDELFKPIDIPVKFEHNQFNNSYIKSVHDQIKKDKTIYNNFAGSFNK